jgi:hypothetical protein
MLRIKVLLEERKVLGKVHLCDRRSSFYGDAVCSTRRLLRQGLV